MKPGDRVVEVNGIRSDVLVKDECNQNKRLELVVRRQADGVLCGVPLLARPRAASSKDRRDSRTAGWNKLAQVVKGTAVAKALLALRRPLPLDQALSLTVPGPRAADAGGPARRLNLEELLSQQSLGAPSPQGPRPPSQESRRRAARRPRSDRPAAARTPTLPRRTPRPRPRLRRLEG
ncbi:unnamed protein product [Prorocentrum cordatum]|uniref:PDZ domain-containing protein n=1 Tax=Prorocentrum cordatum TaxID=2364126 RepID=A0ABN9Q8K6_9DINO|nr:unnamed protein product [Polarella glacialis]